MNKIGVIGLGDIAQKAYLPLITSMEVPLVFCTRNEEKLIRLSKKYRVNEISVDYKELPNFGVDAVFLHTATDSHYDIARFFLEKGIHVFVDKPVSDQIEEVHELYRLAEEKECVLFCGFNRRYIAKIQEMIHTGQPDTLLIQKNRYNLPGTIRSFIFDDFIHVVDTLLFLFQEDDYEIKFNASVENNQIRHITLMLHGDNSTAIGMMNRMSGKKEERIEYTKDNKKVILEDLDQSWVFEKEQVMLHTSGDWMNTLEKRGFKALIEAYFNAIDESNYVDPLTLRSHRLCATLIESIENGQI
jgi:virulence factor